MKIMIQGTTSDAGKSALAAGLCRVLYRKGVSVAPFKPQNMALNSAVTSDGGEIGRAQAVQAFAANIAPTVDMNPILLKPSSDRRSQVIIQGKVHGEMDAVSYHQFKPQAMDFVMQSFERLCAKFSAIVIEGAGSPAEINLRAGDIANMGFAERADCPVVLIADIDRGGVFAHLVGTLELLSPEEQCRVKGFVINRFRGDIALLAPGIKWLEEKTGKPVFGVIPYLHGLHLEAEDAVAKNAASMGQLKVAVPVFPRISNHTDFDSLRLHPEVDFSFIGPNEAIAPCDLLILPGSKNTRSDLEWLRENGWDKAILRHLRYGGKLIGICGGFQMLGRAIHDPAAMEGVAGTSAGLGLFDMETTLTTKKTLREAEGRLAFSAAKVKGYEIHLGRTTGPALGNPALLLADGCDGAISIDGQILGTYLHGLFDHKEAMGALLFWAGIDQPQEFDYEALREREIDRLADALENHLDLEKLLQACHFSC